MGAKGCPILDGCEISIAEFRAVGSGNGRLRTSCTIGREDSVRRRCPKCNLKSAFKRPGRRNSSKHTRSGMRRCEPALQDKPSHVPLWDTAKQVWRHVADHRLTNSGGKSPPAEFDERNHRERSVDIHATSGRGGSVRARLDAEDATPFCSAFAAGCGLLSVTVSHR
jgi:hypothetical protein